MTRSRIAKIIRDEMGCTEQKSLAVTNKIIDGIVEQLREEKRVIIGKFGTFQLRFLKRRLGYDPITGTRKVRPATVNVRFKASPVLRDAVFDKNVLRQETRPKVRYVAHQPLPQPFKPIAPAAKTAAPVTTSKPKKPIPPAVSKAKPAPPAASKTKPPPAATAKAAAPPATITKRKAPAATNSEPTPSPAATTKPKPTPPRWRKLPGRT